MLNRSLTLTRQMHRQYPISPFALLRLGQPGTVIRYEDRLGAGADSEEIGGPIDSTINFSACSSSDCSSFKRGRGKSRRPGTIAMSKRNLPRKMGNNESRKSGAGVATGPPGE